MQNFTIGRVHQNGTTALGREFANRRRQAFAHRMLNADVEVVSNMGDICTCSSRRRSSPIKPCISVLENPTTCEATDPLG